MTEPKSSPGTIPNPLSSVEPPNPGESPVKKKRSTKPAAEYVDKPAAQKPPAEKKARFEYRVVSFENFRGWKARFVDCQEVEGWPNTPLVHEYLKKMGDDGWELSAVATGECLFGTADFYQLFFIRRK